MRGTQHDERKENVAEDPLKMIFNYDNVFFSFFYDSTEVCSHRSPDYALNFVRSGEMVLDDGSRQIHVGKGECAFIPRDHRIEMYKRPYGGERYCGVFLKFTRPFLREMHTCFGKYVDAARGKPEACVAKLSPTTELASLFASMMPYFDRTVRPQDDFIRLKLQEGLLALLHADPSYAALLFDFSEPWKIDILDFMNRNYMYELTMEELAHYTGRSLATFKRDFKKVSELTPEKWLIRRRLDAAYELMRGRRQKIVDVCAQVGFKNPSHFSRLFKQVYGVPPTAVAS